MSKLLPTYTIKNRHDYFTYANSILAKPEYLSAGQIIRIAVMDLLTEPIGSVSAVAIEPKNADATMFTFEKVGNREIEFIGSAK